MLLEGLFSSDNVLLGLLAIAALVVGARFLTEDVKDEIERMDQDVEKIVGEEGTETVNGVKAACRKALEDSTFQNGNDTMRNVFVYTSLIILSLAFNWLGRAFYCKEKFVECVRWDLYGFHFSAVLLMFQVVFGVFIVVFLFKMSGIFRVLREVQHKRQKIQNILNIRFSSSKNYDDLFKF